MAALIDLKLSQNTQFQDRPGACKLIGTAVGRGDRSMTQRLADCRASYSAPVGTLVLRVFFTRTGIHFA